MMEVRLLNFTPFPDLIVYLSARVCYSNVGFDEIQEEIEDREKVRALIREIIRSGHHSVLEHASFTFGIEGISRVTTHQLVRHRIASYSQQSLRWVNAKNISIIIPPSIQQNSEALKLFNEAIEKSKEIYNKLLDLGIPKEDARFIIPQGVSSMIVVTMNARELLHFFKVRLCNRAQWEIRELAKKMLEEVRRVAPIIFEVVGPPCVVDKMCREKNPCSQPLRGEG